MITVDKGVTPVPAAGDSCRTANRGGVKIPSHSEVLAKDGWRPRTGRGIEMSKSTSLAGRDGEPPERAVIQVLKSSAKGGLLGGLITAESVVRKER